MSEIADKLRAVLKLKTQLDAELRKLDTKIAAQERTIKQLRTQREQTQERLASINDALRPLDRLDGIITNGATPKTPTAGPGKRNIELIVEAIGAQGLDEWTPAMIAAATGIKPVTVGNYLRVLVDANRIRRSSFGHYRTVAGTIASGIPLAQGA